MKPRLIWKRGAILLQTLVMSILLSMIAIMVMKWVLARYVLVGRMHRNIAANTRGEGYMSTQFCSSNWKDVGSIPTSASTNLDNPPKSFNFNVVSGTAYGPSVQTVRVTTEQEQ
ncbi:MAG: hypothetical protein HY796_09210 [Elusimicrobia bacterium]|nr:hypothetical protein [Elusimicrobiota bacterium]